MRRVVLDATVGWRVVARGQNDAVSKFTLATTVVHDDGSAERRSRNVLVISANEHVNRMRTQHLKHGSKSGSRQCVGISPDKDWPGNSLIHPILDDCLGDSGNMVFVERASERGASMAGGAKNDSVQRIAWVRLQLVIGGDKRIHIDKVGVRGELTGALMHVSSVPVISRKHGFR